MADEALVRGIVDVKYNSLKMRRYFSPYPIAELEAEQAGGNNDADTSAQSYSRRPSGAGRATIRSHPRTADLVASGQHSDSTSGESVLWVCEMCLKYMKDGTTWDLHTKVCQIQHPPGKKVLDAGGRSIWQVDGAEQKATL